MRPNLVFDLDGTVVWNAWAIEYSYHSAGVTHFPEDWFYRGGWVTAEQRRRKLMVYEKALRRGSRILPAGNILLQTGGTVLTASSQESVDIFLMVYPEFLRHDIQIYTCFSQEEKLSHLRAFGGGVYFDDHAETVRMAREIPGWTAVDASLL